MLEWAGRPEEMAADRYHPGSGQYRRWSELVTEHVERLLGATGLAPADGVDPISPTREAHPMGRARPR